MSETWNNLYEASAAAGSMTLFMLLSALVLLMFLVAMAGSVIPILPGPIFAFFGVLILKLTIAAVALSWTGVLICLALAVLSMLLDYVLPVKYSPTRAGAWGAFVGVFFGLAVGMLFPPLAIFGVFLGPLVCAYLFEYYSNRDFRKAWKTGKGAFWGTLLSVIARIAVIMLMVAVVVIDIVMG